MTRVFDSMEEFDRHVVEGHGGWVVTVLLAEPKKPNKKPWVINCGPFDDKKKARAMARMVAAKAKRDKLTVLSLAANTTVLWSPDTILEQFND